MRRELKTRVGHSRAVGSCWCASVRAFYDSSLDYLAQCKACVEHPSLPDNEALKLIARNIHTIKGNSRALGFTYVAGVAHQVETGCTQIKNTYEHGANTILLDVVQPLVAALADYKGGF